MGKKLEGNKTKEARTSNVICTYCGRKRFYTNLARHRKTCIGKKKQEQKEKKQQLSAVGDTQEKVGRRQLRLFELEVMRVPTAADVRKLDVTVVTQHEEVRPRKAPKKPKTVPSDQINKLSFDVADLTASPLISAACEKHSFQTQSHT